jgi:hypothetical protein
VFDWNCLNLDSENPVFLIEISDFYSPMNLKYVKKHIENPFFITYFLLEKVCEIIILKVNV